MNFLVDAQLPRRVASILRSYGHDAIHTLDLPNANRTTDSDILRIAANDDRIVVSKDADFLNSHLLLGQPSRLLLITTGNISNAGLDSLLSAHLTTIVEAFDSAVFVELTRTALVIHS